MTGDGLDGWSSLHLVSRHQAVNNQGRPEQWERRERQSNPWATKELRQDDANLRSNSCAGLHHERDHYIHVSLDGVRYCPVTG